MLVSYVGARVNGSVELLLEQISISMHSEKVVQTLACVYLGLANSFVNLSVFCLVLPLERFF